MPTPKVFISFSSKDLEKSRRILARLKAHPIEIWDYSEDGQEIPGGKRITPFLKRKIDRCNYFIPIVSQNSFRSPHTRQEVEYALELAPKDQISIIPLFIMKRLPDNVAFWTKPYDYLRKAYTGYDIDLSSIMSQENIIRFLCKDMKLKYISLIYADKRLPFCPIKTGMGVHCRRNTQPITY